MHAHFDPTNPFLRIPSVDTLAHIVYKIIHNIVGLPLIFPSITVHLYNGILCRFKKNEEST